MRKLVGYRKILLGTVCALGLVTSTTGKAQVATYYDNNVMVDLSVLEDGGSGMVNPTQRTPSMNGAKLPPRNMPKSQFIGLPQNAPTVGSSSTGAPQLNLPAAKPQSRIVLRKPTSTAPAKSSLPIVGKAQPKTPVKAVASMPSAPKKMTPRPVAKAPEVKPKAPEVAKVETPVAPPPLPKAEPKQEMAKVTETVKKDVETAVKQETPSPKPAPTTEVKIGAAPPPPPVTVIEPKKVESNIQSDKSSPVATAALPGGTMDSVRITFKEGEDELTSQAKSTLDQLAGTLNQRKEERIQLKGYAGGESVSTSKARRLSLKRALSIRSYLESLNVDRNRIDVRALGNKTAEEPFDRVDVQLIGG